MEWTQKPKDRSGHARRRFTYAQLDDRLDRVTQRHKKKKQMHYGRHVRQVRAMRRKQKREIERLLEWDRSDMRQWLQTHVLLLEKHCRELTIVELLRCESQVRTLL